MGNMFTLDTLKQNYDNYEDRMLAAWVGKPDKFLFYKMAFQKFSIGGVERFAVVWSWWAFFFTFWFFLYRKAYIAALVAFVLAILTAFIPIIGPLAFMIGMGMSAVYFLYKHYKNLKLKIEWMTDDEDKRLEYMLMEGGYLGWVPWVVAILTILSIIFMAIAYSQASTAFQYYY
jgi:hypothetical protein